MSGRAPRRTGAKVAKTKQVAKPYEPKPEERAAVEALFSRQKEKPPAPRMKVSKKGGVAQVLPDHPDLAVGAILLMVALGTTELDFLNGPWRGRTSCPGGARSLPA